MRIGHYAVVRTHGRSCINKRPTRLHNLAGIQYSRSVNCIFVWLFRAHLERDESVGSTRLKCLFRRCSRRPHQVLGICRSARGIRALVTQEWSLHLRTAVNWTSSGSCEGSGVYSLSFSRYTFIQVNSICLGLDNLPICGRCKGGLGT